uniref:Uncharacterized protein n=1 Tax=viral metagenome TaxID=1070528 RepID=A0A6C0ICN6_9ZZZZ
MATFKKLSTVSLLASGTAFQGLPHTNQHGKGHMERVASSLQTLPVKKNINNDMSMEDLKDTIDDLLVLTRRLKERFEHKNVQYRLPNFPDYISENMVMRIIQQTDNSCTRSCSGDLYSLLQGKIEVKCFTSVGPSSFGPKCEWDVIYFLDAMEWTNNHFVLYKINLKNSSEEWKKIKINKAESYTDQCDQKRRPRLAWSLLYPQIREHTEIVFDGSFEDITPTTMEEVSEQSI